MPFPFVKQNDIIVSIINKDQSDSGYFTCYTIIGIQHYHSLLPCTIKMQKT